jgi:hypothetical protein
MKGRGQAIAVVGGGGDVSDELAQVFGPVASYLTEGEDGATLIDLASTAAAC